VRGIKIGGGEGGFLIIEGKEVKEADGRSTSAAIVDGGGPFSAAFLKTIIRNNDFSSNNPLTLILVFGESLARPPGSCRLGKQISAESGRLTPLKTAVNLPFGGLN
jgi:hypothetical protein